MHAFAFGLMLLGTCVFAWGLKYKLSLYDPPQAVSRHMPAAKLLAGKEQITLPSINRRSTTAPGAPLALIPFALAFFALTGMGIRPGIGGRRSLPAPARRMTAHTVLAAHFTRPPPPRG
jgi:hypothetical protein